MPTSLSEAVEAISLSPPLVVENDRAMQERLHYVLSMLGCDEPEIAWTDDDAVAMKLLRRVGCFGFAGWRAVLFQGVTGPAQKP